MNIKLPCVLAIAAAGSTFAAAAESEDRPANVVVILADDLGYGDVGFNGCKDIPTPILDKFVAEGAHVTAGYVTAPQCAPSRAGLLSGRNQSNFARDNNLVIDELGVPKEISFFGDEMRKAKYATGMIGKWHLGVENHPMDRGFDEFFGFLAGTSSYFPRGNDQSIQKILRGREETEVTEYLTTVLGREAESFIKRHKDGPFFLYVAFNAPHSPLEAPAEHLKRVANIKEPRKTYAAMICAMDDAIGGILKTIKDSGIDEDTLVVFLSDNGGVWHTSHASNAPFRGYKGDILDGGARVPFAMRWPGRIPAGTTIEQPVSSLDLLPTALDIAHLEAPKNLDGISLLPYLNGKTKVPERTLMWRFSHPPTNPKLHAWGVRTGDYKLVKENFRNENQKQMTGEVAIGLYDVSTDIREEKDLSAAQPAKRAEMEADWNKWNATLPEVIPVKPKKQKKSKGDGE